MGSVKAPDAPREIPFSSYILLWNVSDTKKKAFIFSYKVVKPDDVLIPLKKKSSVFLWHFDAGAFIEYVTRWSFGKWIMLYVCREWSDSNNIN